MCGLGPRREAGDLLSFQTFEECCHTCQVLCPGEYHRLSLSGLLRPPFTLIPSFPDLLFPRFQNHGARGLYPSGHHHLARRLLPSFFARSLTTERCRARVESVARCVVSRGFPCVVCSCPQIIFGILELFLTSCFACKPRTMLPFRARFATLASPPNQDPSQTAPVLARAPAPRRAFSPVPLSFFGSREIAIMLSCQQGQTRWAHHLTLKLSHWDAILHTVDQRGWQQCHKMVGQYSPR